MKRKIYKEDIIQAGYELMYLNGCYATGIKEITDKVEIPKGSFYNHFKNKEEFGLEVLTDYSNRSFAMLTEKLLESDLTPLNRLKTFFQDIIEYQKEVAHSKLGCLMGNFSQELGDINEHFRASLDIEFLKLEAVFIECIEEAKSLGEIKETTDPNLLAPFLINSWHGALLRMKASGTVSPLEDFKAFVFQQLLN